MAPECPFECGGGGGAIAIWAMPKCNFVGASLLAKHTTHCNYFNMSPTTTTAPLLTLNNEHPSLKVSSACSDEALIQMTMVVSCIPMRV